MRTPGGSISPSEGVSVHIVENAHERHTQVEAGWVRWMMSCWMPVEEG
jgi:hypothetical protein